MWPPLPRPRPYQALALGAIGVTLLVVGALPDDTNAARRASHDLLQTGGGLLLGLSIGGGLIRWLQEREWRKRTFEQAYDLLKQAMFQTTLVAERVLYVLGKPELISDLDLLYRLPYEEAQRLYGKDKTTDAMAKVLGVLEEGDEHIATRAREAAQELESRADRLRQLGLELGPYLAGDPIGLVNKMAELHRRVRDLLSVEVLSKRRDAQLVVLSAYRSLSTSVEVAAKIGAEYAKLRQQPIHDKRLKEEVEGHERMSGKIDRTRLKVRNLLLEVEQEKRDESLRKTEEVLASLAGKKQES